MPYPPTSAARPAATRASPWLIPGVRLALALAYPFLAHAASLRDSGALAACALATIVLMVLAEGLARARVRAWLALAAASAGLVWLARSAYASLPLLLVPAAFLALVAWGFAWTLRAGRVPLITRIVSAMDAALPQQLAPVLQRYARGLTLAWALLLGLLALCNLVLATLVVPQGLLASAGIAPPLAVTQAQASWLGNWLNYGLVGGFFVLEFLHRKRRFPGRYRSLFDFLGRMARLPPAFWRDLFR